MCNDNDEVVLCPACGERIEDEDMVFLVRYGEWYEYENDGRGMFMPEADEGMWHVKCLPLPEREQ